MFNGYFEEQFSGASNYDIELDYSNDSVNDIEFSTSRIRKILKNINVHKSSGPDGIHGKVKKNCRESIAYSLSCLCRCYPVICHSRIYTSTNRNHPIHQPKI